MSIDSGLAVAVVNPNVVTPTAVTAAASVLAPVVGAVVIAVDNSTGASRNYITAHEVYACDIKTAVVVGASILTVIGGYVVVCGSRPYPAAALGRCNNRS